MDQKWTFMLIGIVVGLVVVPWLQRKGDEETDITGGRVLPDAGGCSCGH